MTTASPADVSPAKRLALELASNTAGEPSAVVTRANAYLAFLTGGNAPTAPNGAAAGPKGGATAGATSTPPKGGATAGPKGATSTPPKGGATAGPKGAAGTPPKGAAAAGKGAASTKPNPPANAQPVPGDTKAPNGTNTYADVVAALQQVQAKIGREEAFKILAEDGGNVKSVRELKPANYDAVVEGCNNALSDEGGDAADAGGAAFDDGTSQPEVDDLGLAT